MIVRNIRQQYIIFSAHYQLTQQNQQTQSNQYHEDNLNRSFRQYHPIKIIPKNHWIQETYCPIFIQKQPSPSDISRLNFQVMLSLLPSSIFAVYWILIGPLDLYHIGAASVLAVYLYIISYNLLKLHNLFRIQRRSQTLVALYLHKNGYDWVAVLNRGLNEIKNNLIQKIDGQQEPEYTEIKKILNCTEEQMILSFSLYDIEHIRLPQRDETQQNEIESLKEINDLFYNEVQADIRLNFRKDAFRNFSFDIRQNLKPEYNEFLKPLINKQKVTFRQEL